MNHFAESIFVRRTLLLILLLGGLLIRLPYLNEAPRDFWTVRQYFVPMLAQALYYEQIPGLPQWQAQLVEAHKTAFQCREPPLMEKIGVLVFRHIGGMAFWPLRLQPILAWIAGGFFLFLIARSLFSFRAAMIGLAFYLFLPYGVTASRSLQPDSLMVMALLASAWCILKHHDQPGWRTWVISAVVAGFAILVKPGISQFAVSLIYLSLEVERRGWRRTVRDFRTYVFYLIAALPAACYLLIQRISGGSLSSHVAWNIQPQLIGTIYFWRGWLGILHQIFWLPLLALAGYGCVRLPSRRAVALMLGYGLGYLAQCFFTIAATPSHDYWHLQVIPLVALAVGFALHDILALLQRPPFARIKQGLVWALVFAWLVWAIHFTLADALRPKNTAYIEMAKTIGESVGHSPRTIILDYDKGYSLMYFAGLYGQSWPETAAMQSDHILGIGTDREDASLPARDRYQRFFADPPADFFIVCRALRELDLQPGLRDFLFSNFTVWAQGPRYIIFDLRNKKAEP